MFTLGASLSSQVNPDWQTYIMLGAYFVVLLIIGYYGYKKATGNISEYMLGGRNIGPYVTALSAGASDMSGWMIMGLPGEVYTTGLSAAWLAIGLTIGAYINYLVVAPRLRVYTEKAGDAITLPDFFRNRLDDKSNVIKIISGGIIVVFFTLYTHSGMVSGGKLFDSAFGLDYHFGLLLVAFIVIAYTFFGGYLAVSLTDFFQGVIMLIAMVMVPIVAMMQLSGLDTLSQAAELKPTNLDLFRGTTIIGIISFFAWGLGYFGQPHIIVRFMSIKSVKQLPTARRFGISWMAISLLGAVGVGLVGITFVNDGGVTLQDPETLFILMGQILFHPLVGGFLLAAILAAIMSTISSQLLVTSSSLTEDFYKLFRGEEAAKKHEKEFVLVGRLSVIVVAIASIMIAWTPNDTILNLVGNAWAGFGSAFGPLVLLSLYWKGLSRTGAVSGMLSGAIVVIIWIAFVKPLGDINDFFNLYEIVPGFLTSLIVTIVVSKITKKPQIDVEGDLEEVRQMVKGDNQKA
ncbi:MULTISPECIES: sodium/proline symporter PutP [Staphylococcus]|jgi:sodium/proline symporter|uniref:Sodium/proline symporter n=1 Tax=Staphylococcus nepalensis TaxID=214473 RepID=A0A2T4SDQ8_9STAP|nr:MULTISPECIES: sodium/proline symporter PutP [Staphylococcus]VDG66172.1 osmoregulated proline transporter OpuE [Lacrimispora indolis]MBO1205562.1 sodium/proline symporter PutP [Staphylococcus nepalensis]MBO1212590.1 sodium/proline symporter PutP [Staphylococcus nepalensis]MBO1215966.1 sodium/proline symporter PutP [Staphylococcus nepalensis]MBO1221027.1 sodium/proline symporter PutP [Staphylococcus nepalensis]